MFPFNIGCLSDALKVLSFYSRFHWWFEYSANQLRNQRNGSWGADLRLMLTTHWGGEIREEKDIRNKENPECSFGCCCGESSWLLSWPFPHSSSPCCLFFGGGDYGTTHLPAEAAATRCYDLNTAVWQDDWLRGEAGVVEGVGLGWGGAAYPHPCISRSTFKFKYLSELEIDPFLWLSLPVCCHSSVTPPLQFPSTSVSSLLPSCLQEGKKEQRREQCKKRDRKHERTKREESKAQSSILNQSWGTKIFFFLVVPHDNPAQPPQLWTHLPSQIYPGARNSCRLSSHTAWLLPPSPH